jgi:hypothetical protein
MPAERDFNKGLSIGVLFYIAGAVATVLVHLVTGWGYPHGPPASFMVVILTLTLAFIRSLILLGRILRDTASLRNRGESLIHGTAFFLVVMVIVGLAL